MLSLVHYNNMGKKVGIRTLRDRVVIESIAADKMSKGGIHIPESAQEKPVYGKVIAVGGGSKDEPPTVKAGDTILHGKFAGTEIELDGINYIIMREADLLAVIG